MDRDKRISKAIEHLSGTINRVIEQSEEVRAAVEQLRDIGFEPNLSMRLEVALEEILNLPETGTEVPELELTDDDIRALRRMKIAV